MTRFELLRRLGTALSVSGFLFDIGELATLPDLLPGDEDAAAIGDVVVTYAGGALRGENYVFEQPGPSLPFLLTVNQDDIVTAGDAGSAAMVKILGGVAGGPAGYVVGEATDFVTTAASAAYDYNRNFGSLENHLSVGLAVTSTDQIHSGDTVILIWP